MKYAETEKPQRNKAVFRFMWLLQEVYTSFCRYFETFGLADRS